MSSLRNSSQYTEYASIFRIISKIIHSGIPLLLDFEAGQYNLAKYLSTNKVILLVGLSLYFQGSI